MDELIGQRFERLVVTDIFIVDGHKMAKCICDCGNEKTVRISNLRNGHVKSCGCLRKEQIAEKGRQREISLVGQRFGYLTVVKRAEDYISPKGFRSIVYECLCDCGKTTFVHRSSLKSGNIKSCGCMQRKLNGEAHKKYNEYDLSGEYGIGKDGNDKEFYFDLEDYDLIKDYRWQVEDDNYVTSTDRYRNYSKIRMHRLIMNLYPGNKDKVVDHILGYESRNDNRKQNLRITSNMQNSWNRKLSVSNTSGVSGVCYDKRVDKWRASITYRGKILNLGDHKKFEDAVKARKEAEEKYFGEYSYDNSQKKVFPIKE